MAVETMMLTPEGLRTLMKSMDGEPSRTGWIDGNKVTVGVVGGIVGPRHFTIDGRVVDVSRAYDALCFGSTMLGLHHAG